MTQRDNPEETDPVTAPRPDRPDFFIAGTMKGGTTALYDFINLHEEVTASSQKEIHYFSLHPYRDTEWYDTHFAYEAGKITGEASPTYFDLAYTDAIPRMIQAYNPGGKVIVITRDPVERAVSHFHHLRMINKVPDLIELDVNEFFDVDFEDCITVTDNRNYLLQQVLYFGAYARKAMFYRGVFDPDHLLFLDNAGLRKAPRETMELVFEFLGLEPIQSPEFERVKYSSGRTVSELEPRLLERLTDFYARDAAVYAQVARLATLPGHSA